jgi:RNA polymerase sigma-70 factor (ECF subfamily)
MVLTDARRGARTDTDGVPVLLADQDRSRWDRANIAEGHALVRACLRRDRPGPYQLQAAINAVHCDAPSVAATDWRQVVQLYDQLLAVTGNPIVALNRAVAVAELDGPMVALSLVDRLAAEHRALDRYHVFHAVRADLLGRLGRTAEATAACDAALALTDNAAERALLERRRAALISPGP